MNAETKLECDENKVHDEVAFAAWIEKVVSIDMKRLRNVEKHTRLIEDAVKRSRSILTGPSARANKQGPISSTICATSQFPSVLAKLLDAERTLLNAHEGCTKCRRFYVNHRVKDCPNDFLAAVGYNTLTESMALAAKKGRGGKRGTIAAVIEDAEEMEGEDEFVAVVGMSSSVIGDGTDSDSDECVKPPPPQKHLFLDCYIPSSTSEIHLNALIDHACLPVLIKPEFADKLKLKCMPLHEKMSVKLVVDSSGDKRVEFEVFVTLKLYSVNHSWESKTIRAIVAPNLCTKLILGMSFLATHSIVIDHEDRTIIDK